MKKHGLSWPLLIFLINLAINDGNQNYNHYTCDRVGFSRMKR